MERELEAHIMLYLQLALNLQLLLCFNPVGIGFSVIHNSKER